jgi:hypothetical protein
MIIKRILLFSALITFILDNGIITQFHFCTSFSHALLICFVLFTSTHFVSGFRVGNGTQIYN